MGLAITHSIVEKCGGFITIASEIGKGTTIDMFLPVTERDLKKVPL